ncbi:uncharacterized protein LY89DRAFT_760816 [Mollisia scopiformis]|uniref:Subtilisin-like serine protease protein n=1 Tax=Mollisia scopiformis TaxID=149040 RepID=A0A132BCB6_MOLSC|nr:uncharacterized protein LY89DRAFT_760816 [Mollisia scopiformis]KUJ10011.1 hypothetical protein LY89DRAFT_760816 [Mollisia scopiformis]
MTVLSAVPFKEAHELNKDLNPPNNVKFLPGYRQISLRNTQDLYPFLSKDPRTPDLEKIGQRLWWMTKQSSAHVAPLHHQAVKLRRIVVTENPELHLVWYYDLIYIKQLPKYLLSYKFWSTYLTTTSPMSISAAERELLERSALGFLRTYWHLIKYESDFNIAQEMRLIPPTAAWESFSAFIAPFQLIRDDDVTERCRYGQIRLSRLNLYGKLFLRRRYFHNIYGQYDTYFSRLYGPLLFIFGLVSLFLNSLQVELAVEPLVTTQWPRFWTFSRRLAVLFVGFVFAVLLVLVCLFIAKFATEWFFAIRDRRRRLRKDLIRKSDRTAGV